MISIKGVSTNPDKIESIQNWPTPSSITSLRGFLGLTGYYRRFVQKYAQLAAPLTDLLQQNRTFQWSDAAQKAFTALKDAMMSLPTLTLPDFT